MSEIKTVTHEGKVYQIGKLYAFSDDKGVDPLIDRLSSISNLYNDDEGNGWKYIKAIAPSKIGTITPAPIELINGAPYMFDVRENTFLGFYRESRKSFFYEITNGNKIAGASEATNIRLMTVESK
jgi:hypothetical protein